MSVVRRHRCCVVVVVNYNWHKASLGKRIQVCSNEGFRPFLRGDNCEMAKIHWQNLKNVFSKTTGPFSTKLGTKNPWVKGFQVINIRGSAHSQRGDNYEIGKLNWQIWKIVFSKTTEPISTIIGTKHPWVKGFKFVQMKGSALF